MESLDRLYNPGMKLGMEYKAQVKRQVGILSFFNKQLF
jgi:hypothetical protein